MRIGFFLSSEEFFSTYAHEVLERFSAAEYAS
jgi:hypothetical protein